MNKQELYDYLTKRQISYETMEHEAVYNMAEMAEIVMPHPEVIAKNLFLRDDCKRNYYLISIKGDKRVDLKELRRKNGTRRLSFADNNEMKEILGLSPGSITPLGLLNDQEHKVVLFLDKDFLNAPSLIGIHPNDNTATLWMNVETLMQIIKEHGNEVNIIEINEV